MPLLCVMDVEGGDMSVPFGNKYKIDEIGRSAVLSQLLGKWSKSGALAAAFQTLRDRPDPPSGGGSGYETNCVRLSPRDCSSVDLIRPLGR